MAKKKFEIRNGANLKDDGLRITGTTSGYTEFDVPASGNQINYTLPGVDGSNGQVFTTDGSGGLSWTTQTGSGTVNTGVSGFMAFYPSNGTTVDDTSNVFWDEDNDRLGVGTSSPDSKLTVSGGNIKLVSDDQLLLPQGGSDAAPTLAFGDGDTGFRERTPNNLSVAFAGARKYSWATNFFRSDTAGAWDLRQAASSDTVPTFTFNDDIDTGLGTPSANNMSIITSGVEAIRINDVQNVGIGTADLESTSKLTVSGGDIKLTGDHQLLLPQGGSISTPTLAFGDGDTGFRESSVNQIAIIFAGGNRYSWASNFFRSNATGAWDLRQLQSSDTVPTFTFNGDINTGLGTPSPDNISIITSGVEAIRIDDVQNVGIGTADLESTSNLTISGGDLRMYDGQVIFKDGSASSPGFRFDTDNTGLYHTGATGQLGFVANGGSGGYFFESGGIKGGGIGQAHVTFNQSNNVNTNNYAFTADTNTGMSRFSADHLQLVTSGVRAILIDSEQQVGIGTTSPAAKLDVNGSLRLRGSTTGYSEFTAIASGDNVDYTLPPNDGVNQQVLTTDGTGTLTWTTASGTGTVGGTGTAGTIPKWADSTTLEDSVITESSSKIGINVSSPSDTLTISGGNLKMLSDQVIFQDGSASTPGFRFITDNTGLYHTGAGGQLGFSANGSSGGYFFETGGIKGGGTGQGHVSFNQTNNVSIVNYGFTADTNTGMLRFSADHLALVTSGQYALLIDSEQQVGIGTTAPSERLTVSGGNIKLVSDDQLLLPQGGSNSEPTLAFGDGDTGVRENSLDVLLIIHAGSGNHQWGSNFLRSQASRSWDLRQPQSSDTLPCFTFNGDLDTGLGSASDNNISIITSGVEAIRIDSDQNVGLGTGSPSGVFDLKGISFDDVAFTSSVSSGVSTIDSFAVSGFHSCKYIIGIKDEINTEYQTSEIVLVHDDSTATISTFGTVFTGSSARMTFSATVSGANVLLQGTGVSSDNTVKLRRIAANT